MLGWLVGGTGATLEQQCGWGSTLGVCGQGCGPVLSLEVRPFPALSSLLAREVGVDLALALCSL